MAKNAERRVVIVGFDYSPLPKQVAERTRGAAERIRDKVKKTLEDIIGVGKELLVVKQALPHGQFGVWLRAEFGWTERTAQNFMSVADRFGPKTEIISDLRIAPTAAYLLAAPSAPDEARQAAVERAEAGETITGTTAREIVSKAKKKERKKPKAPPATPLRVRLAKVLETFRDRCSPKELPDLARQLRDFADLVDRQPPPVGKAPRTV